MNQIKDMLLGISIILIVILIHLFVNTPFWSDVFGGGIGIIFILKGYSSKGSNE